MSIPPFSKFCGRDLIISILGGKWIRDSQLGPGKFSIVKVWRSFFGGDDGVAVVVSAGAKNSQLCLAQGGALVNAVVVDMGAEDFAFNGDKIVSISSSESLISFFC